MEGAMAVRVTAAHTAEAEAEAGREAGGGGVAAAAALASSGFLGLPAPFSEEDEDDVHRCGRCQAEFTTLEDFVQHKMQKACQRVPQDTLPATPAAAELLGQEVIPSVPPPPQVVRAPTPEEPITLAHIVVEATSLAADLSHTPDLVGNGHIKEVIVAAEAEPGDCEVAEGPGLTGEGEPTQVQLLVNKEGRYVCVLCRKTFKTGSILKAHMVTHSSRKEHECKLCGASFRTKGSLIRHHRRHTDERPYKCVKCGKSFRESGALTRHLKSLTPCTEKIRFSVAKDVAVCKEEGPAGSGAASVGMVASSSVTEEPIETSPVIHLVTDAKGTVIHEVHVRMQKLPLGMKALDSEPPSPEELPCTGEGSQESLLHQFCSRGFREKGSLVRHVRHHTGEKPFKCYRCGRGFAEHGTLNRHLRTKGGCLLEVEEMLVPEESPAAAATVLAEDPHTVLVEFSSMVADTQEYIIEATADDAETSEATEVIEGTQTEVDSHIMKVVRQIVHQAGAGHQIIVQNMTVDQQATLGPEATADTITIATPESLTEQVAMTLASAISEGTVLTARSGTSGAEQATVTMVSSEDIEILGHAGELVISSPEGQIEVQTVIV
ncbi:PREDICTED: transcription factor E4F1 isoform X2 [Chrysochloris asiatica]|uniref:Transcription factor E4F1 isoform X2 n=1 Tax=Chrysochloris asiatica TaxID=185453 RepID=A0A9B0U773_CHRAS|nr:PREDICTED: transcription factor E4F1 isoform X2 [Chrysochloris asiatica]